MKAQEVFPGVWKVRFGSPEKLTPLTFRSAQPREMGLNAKATAPQLPFKLKDIHFQKSARGCSVEVPMGHDEKVYGLGLSTSNFELSGHQAWVVPSDHPEEDSNESHAPEPFYVSSAGYGIYVDTARYALFSIGNQYKQGKDHPRTIHADIPSVNGVDVYVFAGPTALDAVQRYNLFSGGGAVPPMWGLGIAYRGKGDFSAKNAIDLAKTFRDDNMPCDIFGIEPGWQTQTYSCSFLWNKARFPDPQSFIDQMHSMGYRMSFWEHPFSHPSSPIHEALAPFSGSHLVWNGLVPDFATPQARKIFLGQQNESLFSKGVDSLKIDEVDSQPFKSDRWSFPDSAAFPSGLDGEQMHSLFGELSQQTMWQPYREKNLRTWGLVRNSHALAAPLPYSIYSDTYDHRCFVRGLAKSGFGGHLWTPEVRDAKTVEDLIRRVQTVIFSPYAMVNCWYMKLPPWQQIDADKASRDEIMPESAEATRLVRSMFQLRMSLIPYLYSAFNKYNRLGTPTVRAMVLDYPNDPELASVDDQLMFGSSMMVAPMFAGQSKRSVTFPKGDWYDFFTHEKIKGGRKIEITKKLDQLPLYVKSGTILPLASPVGHVAQGTQFELSVVAFGENPWDFTLYEDDGETYNFEKGEQNQVTLSIKNGEGSIKRSGSFKAVRYSIKNWTLVP